MDGTKPKTFVFVLMPFDDEFSDTYELGIKAACADAGAYCERVDEQIFTESILERVYNQISKADVVVADMTGRNPNVFYETGYAHALNKTVILLTRDADDIPFDLKHYPHIVYGGKIASLKSDLEKRVRWCIENPREELSTADLNLEYFVEGRSLKKEPKIHVDADSVTTARQPRRFQIRIGVHNSGTAVVSSDSFKVAIVGPEGLLLGGNEVVDQAGTLPEGDQIWQLRPPDSLFPDGWHFWVVGARASLDFLTRTRREFGLRLRVFSPFGSSDRLFTVCVRRV